MPEPLHLSSYTSRKLSRKPFTQSFDRPQEMLLGSERKTLIKDITQFHRTASLKSYEINISTCPLSLTATFSTAPPCSYVIGGVSLHPPERSIRAEIKHLIIQYSVANYYLVSALQSLLEGLLACLLRLIIANHLYFI